MFDKSARKDGTFSRTDFTFDVEQNIYLCPQGKPLTTTGHLNQGRTLYYRARKLDCETCPLKSKCCPKAPSRRITRDIDEDARDLARSLAGTPAFEQSRRERKKVEMAFAHLKKIFRLARLRLRGPRGAQDEFLLAATAQNLKKLAKYMKQPPPLAMANALRQDQDNDRMKQEQSAKADKRTKDSSTWSKAKLNCNDPSRNPNNPQPENRLLQQYLPKADIWIVMISSILLSNIVVAQTNYTRHSSRFTIA